MQAVCCTSSTAFKGVSVASAARPVTPVVRAEQNLVKKVAAASAALPALLASHPALALVDDRLSQEGTGRVLGVGGPEGFAIVVVFTIVWALYFNAQKDLGGDQGDDSGLTL